MFDLPHDGVRGDSWWDSMADALHGPVDPSQGSQGRPIAPATDGSFLGNMGQTLGDLGRGISSEGILGLLDPVGMMDRAAAHRELAGRFNVMPEGAVGTREQNQVSQEEFDRIARTYSDIRLGRSDLRLAGQGTMTDAQNQTFRSGAMNDIADILQTESGRGLIDSLAHAPVQADGSTHRITTINPRLDAAGAFDPSNAEGGGTFGRSGYATYVPGANTAPAGTNIRSDVTLYHELTHAHHAVYNTWDADRVGMMNILGMQIPDPFSTDPDQGLGEFEHQAAGLGRHANDPFSENRYRGERRRIGELDVGERTTGSQTDDNMMHRDQYRTPRDPATGAVIPQTTPATIPPLGSGRASGAAIGDAMPVGMSTDDLVHYH